MFYIVKHGKRKTSKKVLTPPGRLLSFMVRVGWGTEDLIMHNSVDAAPNGMKVGDTVKHAPGNRNWRFKGCTKNPRSKNRLVRITELYHHGVCAVITPICGYGEGQEYLCNVSDLVNQRPGNKKVTEETKTPFLDGIRAMLNTFRNQQMTSKPSQVQDHPTSMRF